ncbi:MAG: hypothetical protein AAF622_20175 [Cyanobacteria bacterium P01_C01_bin.147]
MNHLSGCAHLRQSDFFVMMCLVSDRNSRKTQDDEPGGDDIIF